MDKHVCIVRAGSPNNKEFDYRKVFEPLQLLLESNGFSVTLVGNAEEGIWKLNDIDRSRHEANKKTAQMYVVYISGHYCEEALKKAKSHSPRIRFIVYSVGHAPPDMPTFVWTGMLTKETINNIFD
ncbi:MAG: hypothetical protein ACAH17_01875 [Candidatus Paceibacterota bacterium]